jgi:hypothetical protein
MKIVSNYPINEVAIQDISSIMKDYDILAIKRIRKGSKFEFLTDSAPKTCRYCGQTYPKVRFKQRAHTIPEFTGNKKLFSRYECDECNESYFNLFDNEFANFMLPFNTLSGIVVKKNKIPKYNQKGEPIIEFLTDKISISKVSDSAVGNFDVPLELTVKLPAYIPEYIYRCLIKIGLGILQEKDLIFFKTTKEWLMNLSAQSNIHPYMIFSTYPNSVQMNEIVCLVLKRKDTCIKNISSTILFLSYSNYAFQTYFPLNSKEEAKNKIQVFPYIYPTTIDLNKDHAPLRTFNAVDLSSKERKTDERITITISGDRK